VSSVETPTRVGLIVPKFRQSAVMRNRLKRRLRELSRIRLLTARLRADIVIRIRPNAYQTTFAVLSLEMDQLLAQLIRWSNPKPSVRNTPASELDQDDT
jgi:ribonuclease P protein component